jgi:error-prone DNA polymerase
VVEVGGVVTHRQQPETAHGVVFLNLEDETGLVNIIVRPDLYERARDVLVAEPVLEVDGFLQSEEGLSVRATSVRAALLPVFETPSRDFR